jgi:hypothetical protein
MNATLGGAVKQGATVRHDPRGQSLSFVVEVTAFVRSVSHRQGLFENVNEREDRPQDGRLIRATASLGRRGDEGRVSFVGASHISSPQGVRQRLAAGQLTGRLSMARSDEPRALSHAGIPQGRPRVGLVEIGDVVERPVTTSHLGPASGRSAVLGRDALGSRATAFSPTGAI